MKFFYYQVDGVFLMNVMQYIEYQFVLFLLLWGLCGVCFIKCVCQYLYMVEIDDDFVIFWYVFYFMLGIVIGFQGGDLCQIFILWVGECGFQIIDNFQVVINCQVVIDNLLCFGRCCIVFINKFMVQLIEYYLFVYWICVFLII